MTLEGWRRALHAPLIAPAPVVLPFRLFTGSSSQRAVFLIR